MAANKKTAGTQLTDPVTGTLPVSISREELRRNILDLFVHQARIIGWMTSAQTAWAFLGKQKTEGWELFDPDEGTEELGLIYADIEGSSFAKSIEAMYDYAYFGLVDESAEPMTLESIYTWTCAILDDMSGSSVMTEWEGYGTTYTESARNCRRVAEIANARVILEGGEGIFYFHSPDGDFAAGDGSLTVRQLALLSGMEEHSIRAAANPKRANPLETYSDEGRTRISIVVAKSWLASKGRYVPIARRNSDGDFDLTSRKFSSVDSLHAAIEARCSFLVLRDNKKTGLRDQLTQIGVPMVQIEDEGRCSLGLERAHLSNHEFLSKLAGTLALDADLLVLRVREAIATEELTLVNSALRQIKKT